MVSCFCVSLKVTLEPSQRAIFASNFSQNMFQANLFDITWVEDSRVVMEALRRSRITCCGRRVRTLRNPLRPIPKAHMALVMVSNIFAHRKTNLILKFLGDHNGNAHEKLLTGGLSEPDAGHFLHKPKHVQRTSNKDQSIESKVGSQLEIMTGNFGRLISLLIAKVAVGELEIMQ